MLFYDIFKKITQVEKFNFREEANNTFICTQIACSHLKALNSDSEKISRNIMFCFVNNYFGPKHSAYFGKEKLSKLIKKNISDFKRRLRLFCLNASEFSLIKSKNKTIFTDIYEYITFGPTSFRQARHRFS